MISMKDTAWEERISKQGKLTKSNEKLTVVFAIGVVLATIPAIGILGVILICYAAEKIKNNWGEYQWLEGYNKGVNQK